MKAFISGCAGTTLTDDERAFFADERPWGLILFGRNVESPQQIADLCSDFRRIVRDDRRPVLIDQEGGRVQRIKPPLAPNYPTNAKIAEGYGVRPDAVRRAVYVLSRLHAFDLARVGVDVNCLPVLDVPAPGADPVIGSRAYGRKPDMVAELGREACLGLLDGGALPVIKHMPGHGRADVDSHRELPRVTAPLADLATRDFVPFARLSDMPLGMTAHVVFDAIDPLRPATLSGSVVSEVIRGAIGFDGLLMTDDMSMHALSGPFEERTRMVFAAGVDIALHCNGVFEEMRAVASATPELTGRSAERSDRALAMRGKPNASEEAALRDEFEELTGHSVGSVAA